MFFLYCTLQFPNPLIHKIVAYEPLFLFGQPGADEFKTLLEHYQKYAAESDVYSAMESLTKDSKKYLVVKYHTRIYNDTHLETAIGI